MASFVFASGGLKNFITLPAQVVDRHLKSCSGESVKVLLYLLRHEDVSLTDEELAAGTGVPVEQIAEALEYWIRTGVLHRSGATLSLAAFGSASGSMPVFSGQAIALRAEVDKELAGLFRQAELIRGEALSPAYVNAVYNLYDGIGLPAAVIALLLEYCAEAGKTGSQYLYVTGAAWAEEGIDTAQAAGERIESLRQARALEGRVASALGLGRALSSKEKSLIAVWSGTYEYGLPEIVYAFEQSVDHTGKLSFSYMNKVLENAYGQGCKTAEDMKNLAPAEKKAAKRTSRPLKNNGKVSLEKGEMFRPFWEIEEE